MDLNIICFLWNGDRWQDDQHDGQDYVNRLYNSIQRNTTLPHNFICLTDKVYSKLNPGIEIIPMRCGTWKGCLPKLSMFDPILGLTGQVFSIDIDVIITGDLDPMLNYRGDFCTRSKFKAGLTHLIDGDVVGFKVQDSIVEKVWKQFHEKPDLVEWNTQGRERYYYREVFKDDKIDIWQELFPGQLLSYKNHVQGKELPEDARIVSFHGKPRPHQLLNIQWIKNNWK